MLLADKFLLENKNELDKWTLEMHTQHIQYASNHRYFTNDKTVFGAIQKIRDTRRGGGGRGLDNVSHELILLSKTKTIHVQEAQIS